MLKILVRRALVVAAVFGTAYLLAPRLDAGERSVYAIVDIDAIGAQGLAAVKEAVQPAWTIESDRELLVLATPARLAHSPRPYKILDVTPNEANLYLIRIAHAEMLSALESDVLIRGGRHAIVQARTPYLESRLAHPTIEPFQRDQVLARQSPSLQELGPIEFSPGVERAVNNVDGARWLRDVNTLAGYNRYTHGPQILQARDWLVNQFSDIGDLEVTTQEFMVRSTKAYNVIAKWTGTTRPDEWYIVGGHYDAISENSTAAAPGAEDNGSGSAGVIEMARQIVAARPEATVIFVAFSGEEQGLNGGYAHARKIVEDGDKAKVKAVINMDMIGYTGDDELDCLLETDARGSALFPTFQAAAARFTRLRIVTSLNPWGSDHVPYIEEGIPSLLTIENDWDDYPSYHRRTDTPDKVTQAMGEEVLRMNLAALLQMAGS